MSGTPTRAPLLFSDHSARGSETKPCSSCRKTCKDEKEIISNGLRIIRIRFSIPYCELPDLKASELSRYLLFLLSTGKVRTSQPFPRTQKSFGKDGLCELQRLCRRDRWELAHSLNSIKRSFPLGCKRHTPSGRSAWEQNAFSTPPPSSPDFIAFVRREVRKIFPYGWDRNYEQFVLSHVPNATSRLNCSRADRHWSTVGRKEFLRRCIKGDRDPSPFNARYKEVMSAGKCRPLLIYDEDIDILAPLHKLLYDHLGRMPWLLKGPPTQERISSVSKYKFGTSVDLVNATDNLSHEVTEAILGSITSKSRLPGSIIYRAYCSLRPVVDGREVTHGQMMGSYLSFPLLCLHSYLAARYATRNCESNILVNGDDTYISSSAPVSVDDYPSGYQLNVAKTIFNSDNVAEINSTVFLKSRGKWREVRHLRRGGFLADFPGMLHIAAAVRHSVPWTNAFIRSRIGKSWGFLPSQLGLTKLSYPAFCRQRDMWNREYSLLPGPGNPSTTELSMVARPLDPDEQTATTVHMFANGRDGGRKRDVFSPSIGEVRRSYRYRTRRLWSRLTFLSQVACEGLPVKSRDAVSFVPREYYSMREEKEIRSLHYNVVILAD